MNHHHKHKPTLTKPTGGSNLHNRQPTNPPSELGSAHNVNAHISKLPAAPSTEQFRVRVSSEAEKFCASDGNVGVSTGLGHEFEVGDLVWGKVKSHPWWPGYICNEAFACSSARSTKKEGRVLVAFFADGSYGWFHPAQLIPFDANFAEKSKQLKLKSFSNAVEEAVEEASRRCALGLMCRCRNNGNFHPTEVEGYFCVNVPDYDSGIYSEAQIRKARNGFRPSETLAFIKKLAANPHGGDDRCCSFAKNKAAVFALRRVVFDLHDESNVEAVRAQPLRSYDPQAKELVQLDTYSDTHISKENNGFGPAEILTFIKQLAIARHYVDRRSSSFAKNKGAVFAFRQVVFKLHGETYVEALGAQPLRRCNPQANLLVQPPSHPASDYDCGIYSEAQTRKDKNGFGPAETLAIKQLATAPHGGDHKSWSFSKNKAAVLSLRRAVFNLHDETYVKVFEKQPLHPSNPQAAQPLSYRANAPLNSPVVVAETLGGEKNTLKSVKAKDNVRKHKYILKHQGEALEKHEDTVSINQDAAASTTKSKVAFEDQVQVDGNSLASQEITYDAKHHLLDKDKVSSEQMTKRFEPIGVASKRLVVMALPTKTSIHVKHDNNVILSSGPHEEFLIATDEAKHHRLSVDGVPKKINVQKRPTYDMNLESSVVGEKRRKKKAKRLNLQPTSDHVEKPSTSEKFVYPSGKVDVSASKLLRVRRLLYELKAIALDPLHGVKKRIPSIVIKFFLRFRSLVYQKSLLLSPPTKNEAPEVRVTTKYPSNDHASDSQVVNPVKQIVPPDDPSKAARKRAITDRQEEINAKRLKKIKELKALDAEKKDGTQAPSKRIKPDSTRKVKRPAKRFQPTELAIKFPPMTSLPSVTELKARFARFGPIHQSSLRVFSKSSTCRVVFFCKIDAQAAHKFAVANQSLFGNAGVRYILRELEHSSRNISKVAKASEDIGANETQHVKDPAVVQNPLPQPMVQLKSILKKKPNRDVLGQGTGKRTQRVKFMLAEEESSRGNRNNSNLDDGSAHSSIAKDFNTKNVQKVISQPSLPIPPFHTQSAKTTQHNLHDIEMAPINTPNFTNTAASTTTTTVDISQQMMCLLTRCHGVVTNLTGSGYVPFRPL